MLLRCSEQGVGQASCTPKVQEMKDRIELLPGYGCTLLDRPVRLHIDVQFLNFHTDITPILNDHLLVLSFSVPSITNLNSERILGLLTKLFVGT